MHNLPFPSDKPLFEAIRNTYLSRALHWLSDSGDSVSSTFLGAKTGSTWGVAYTLICLFRARDMYLQSELLPGGLDEKAHASAEFLIKRAVFGSTTCHWEGNIWDTAVITRALILYAEFFPAKSEQIVRTKVLEKSLAWLGTQVMDWHDLRYTLGLSELSQIFRTFLVAQHHAPELVREIQGDLKPNEPDVDILRYLAEEIVHSAHVELIRTDGESSEQIITWDSGVFGTAETLISLSHYLDSRCSLEHGDLRGRALSLIGPALRYIEVKQVDGRWGIEEETALALRAYLAGHKVWGERFDPEPHIVFKALRYLCDEKTVFRDGSIAHEMEPTIYYTLALIETLSNWNLPDGMCCEKPVMELYDYIIWNTPSRTTYERLLRAKAESEASIVRDLNSGLTNRLVSVGKQLGFWQGIAFVTLWVLVLAMLLSVSDSLTATVISVPVGFQINNWEVFLALVGAWATLGYTVYRLGIRRLNSTR